MVSTTFSFASAILGLALMVSCQQPEVKPAAEETPVLVDGEEVSTRPPLTGIPQIDYIWDPNLPHELNGYNLSHYPFYRRVPPPDKMEFECDGLHDGFYASVLHKCQVYHQCLFGLRYDFLCANFTAFDQKNFICHFANEVDCENSPKFFDRNEALYKTTSTTPLPTPPPVVVVRTRFVDEEGRPVRRPNAGRFRRPNGKRRPVYYDDYYDYDYQEYYDAPAEEEDAALTGSGPAAAAKAEAAPLEEEVLAAPVKPVKAGGGRPRPQSAGQGNRLNIFNNNRPPPRIRPPVPNSEAKKPNKPTKSTTTTLPPPEEEFEYVDYVDGELPVEEIVVTSTTTTTTTTPAPPPRKRFRRPKTTTTAAPVIEEEFVDEAFFEEEFVEPVTTTQRSRRPTGTRRQTPLTTEATTTTTTAAATVEEEPTELASKRNFALFNRRTSVNNLLRRKNNNVTATTTTLPEDIINEEEFVDEPVEEVVPEVTSTTTTTTTTPAPTRRTTKARPPRPANTARTRPTEAPIFVEEEPPATALAVEVIETPADIVEAAVDPSPIEEAPVLPPVRGRVRRPQTPVRVEEEVVAPVVPVAPVASRRGSQRQARIPVIVEADVGVEEENIREGRDLADESSRTVLEESTNFDEDLGESQQWSIINLFSRVYPHRA